MSAVARLAVLFCSLYSLSFGVRGRPSLLTADHGIVTEADLEEEETRCSHLAVRSQAQLSCLHYWQCLPTHDVHLACEDAGWAVEHGAMGWVDFRIRTGNDVHHYYTRRNFSMDTCRDWLEEWRRIIDAEEIVCLSGDLLSIGASEDRPSGPPGMHHYWIIDRMKSHRGDWSYFHRGPEPEPGS